MTRSAERSLFLVPSSLFLVLWACGPKRTEPKPKPPLVVTADAAVVAAPPDAAPAPATPIADAYRDVGAKIVEAALADPGAYDKLRHLTDRIGHRLAGSKALDEAIAWAEQAMKADGHDTRLEKAMVRHWVRGAESAKITTPIDHPMTILGLGGTVATPKGGLTASVVVVTSWDDLAAKADQVKGKIVLYDVAMPAWTEEGGTGYDKAVEYRWAGPSQAAKLGAVGSLMRSPTARSLATPHTGGMGYEDGVAKIPCAAVTVEDAELIHRLIDDGDDVKVKLVLSGKTLPDVESHNVIGELRGGVTPEEVVLIGAHIDSWDVGQGAHDDGAGVVGVMQALTVIRNLGLTPRRTIRVVLFTNEENGLGGAKAYADAHKDEVELHVAAMEMDLGAFTPYGYRVADGIEDETKRTEADDKRRNRMLARAQDLATLLAPIDATRAELGWADADVSPLARAGVPIAGLITDSSTYFDYHHTEADTFDKIDAAVLAKDVAAIALWAYVTADLPARFDDPLDGEP